MTGFFKERNATELPYVEVYVGPNFVEALVTHPSSMEGGALRVPLVLSLARRAVLPCVRAASGSARLPLPPGLHQTLAVAQRLRREAQWQSTSAKWQRERDSLLASLGRVRERLAAERAGLAELLQLRAKAAAPGRGRERREGAHPADDRSSSYGVPRRAAPPMRGSTGGRRKGFRGD